MREHIQDQWAPLSFIPGFDDVRQGELGNWISAHDMRRITAYRVLASYRENTRRYFSDHLWEVAVDEDGTVESPGQHLREYGRGQHLMTTARSLLLGDEQVITVPALQDAPDDPDLLDALAWWTGWAEKERLIQKLLEGEEHTIGDGDGVYVLGWSSLKQRPTLRVYDPGFYFPDLSDMDGWDSDEFPHTVHIAWEYEQDNVKWVRRTTWTIRPMEQAEAVPWGGVREWACFMRTVDYRHDRLLPDVDVYSPELARQSDSEVVQDWTDTGLDFIPIVHVPNDPATQRHFGRALILYAARVLDDLSGNDTDLIGVATTSASPFLAHDLPETSVPGGPGTALRGNAEWVDTSKNLVALRDMDRHLTEILNLVTRLPASLLGQVDPSDVPSGYALQLGFHPARQLLSEMRLVRAEKYPLILKFAYRIAQTGGIVPDGETPVAAIELGASLPSDRAAVVDEVRSLLEAGAISINTAVAMLQSVGLPIADATAEVEQITREDFEAAVRMVEATGDVDAARERLGLQPAPAPEMPNETDL